jgi:hypothetical protein
VPEMQEEIDDSDMALANGVNGNGYDEQTETA